MKFSCNTVDLLQALQLTSRAISGQQVLPILQNVLIKVEGKLCTISATDLELSIVTHFEASIENEGSITVPAKALLNFAQYTSDPEVLLETVEGTQLKCTSAHSKTMMSGESAQDYPTITPVEKKVSFSLESTSLLSALHLVTFTSAKTTLRPVLSGVYVHTKKDELTLVATDSYRLSEYTIPAAGVEEDLSYIIPVKVLDELKNILSGRKSSKKEKDEEMPEESTVASVQVTLSPQQIELQAGPTKLISRLIDGKFPDYTQIIPPSFSMKSTVQVKDLTTTVKRMHYFAKEVNNSITCHFTNTELKLSTPSTQLGHDEATIAVQGDGEHGKIALSSSYLLDFLSHTDEGEVVVQISDSMRPAVFKFTGSEKFLHLIMPLRMQDE